MMRDRRTRPALWRWLRQPRVGWLAVAWLYLIAAVLAHLLAQAMHSVVPMLISAASVLASTQCVLTAVDREADPPMPPLPRAPREAAERERVRP